MKNCTHMERKNTFDNQIWYCARAYPEKYICFEGILESGNCCAHYECEPDYKFEIPKNVFTMEE